MVSIVGDDRWQKVEGQTKQDRYYPFHVLYF